jgi:hypothetical protein
LPPQLASTLVFHDIGGSIAVQITQRGQGKMMRCLLAAILCMLLSTAMAGAQPARQEGILPVMILDSVPAEPAALEQIRACGVNIAGIARPEQLDAVHEAGLRAIVSDPRLTTHDWSRASDETLRPDLQRLVREVNHHPAVFGYYLAENPPAQWFSGLGRMHALLRDMAPGKLPYVNLFPNDAVPRQLGAANYEAYLQQFITTCLPPLVSYHHYALMENGSLGHQYWRNLEQVRAASLQHKLPFWNTILTTAHADYREVSAADLRFQVYSTLAYGGRGIAYNSFFAPPLGNHRGAPVDQFGHTTATFDALRHVNLQIEKLAPVLLRLRSNAVYHFGEVPPGGRGPSPGNLVVAINSHAFMIGDFTHEQDLSRWVMIVNRDLHRSHDCWPTYRGSQRGVRMLSPYTGELVPFEGEQIWLAPGQGALLRVE